MFKKILILSCGLFLLASGCASTVPTKRSESVNILLKNGDKIKADVLDIHRDKIIFKTNDWKKAYEYGEVINIERIKGIKIADGTVLSVKEFDAYRKDGEKDGKIESAKKAPQKTENLADSKKNRAEKDPNFHYEELKKKPISEMTDNEFRFFMMMKDRELIAQREAAPSEKDMKYAETPVDDSSGKEHEKITIRKVESLPEKKVQSIPEPIVGFVPNLTGLKLPQDIPPQIAVSNNIQLDQVVNSLIEAELAPLYLSYLSQKNNLGEPLTPAELTLLKVIKKNPEWLEQVEEIKYIDRTAQKTLSRAYLYNPDDLTAKLDLKFDQDLDMDYFGLMEQLHRKIGEDVKMGDFRILVDVLGENGGQAIKEILENYPTWQFILNRNNRVATK